MKKLKIELKVTEISDGNIGYTEETIKEIDVFEQEWIEYYESMKENNDMMKKLDMVYGMIDLYEKFERRHGNTTLCYGCLAPINKEDEKERFEEEGKIFVGNCWECFEQGQLSWENIEYEESELSEQDEDDNTLQRGESSSKGKRKRTEGETNDREENDKGKRVRIEDEELTEEEEILENETEVFEKLLKDLSTPVMEKQLIEEDIEEMTLEKLFIRAEKGSQELVKYWFDVGEEFKNEIRRIKSETNEKEKTIRSDIYNRLEKNLRGRTRSTIKMRLTRAEKVYKLFKGIGGKQKINRMKNTCMKTIIKLRVKDGEIDELIRRINEIEEEKNNAMEE